MATTAANKHFPFGVTRDTRAWRLQVWISFGIAVFLCATGLAYLPGAALDRAFMVMGYVFCLSTVFVLSKAVRDAQKAAITGEVETPMWRLVVWGGFGVAMGLTAWGLLRMDVNVTYRAYLGVSWLYLVTSAFTLAKTLRDRHEADLLEAQLHGERLGRNQAMADRAASEAERADSAKVA
ncbi:MAG TPA: YiaA/YiaB family inner membrane protein [Hydrogenophaga sp.]